MTTFFIMGLFPIGSYLEYYLLKKNFYNNKTIDNFDALLVLGGDEKRIIYAVNLVKKQKNAKLIIVGGSPLLIKSKENNERIKIKRLIDNIIDNNDYYVLPNSRNTIENMLEFKKFDKNKKFERVVLMTSPIHMKRSLAISKKMDLEVYPYYWKARRSNFSFINYYQTFSFIQNTRSFDGLIREYLGILSLHFVDLKNY